MDPRFLRVFQERVRVGRSRSPVLRSSGQGDHLSVRGLPGPRDRTGERLSRCPILPPGGLVRGRPRGAAKEDGRAETETFRTRNQIVFDLLGKTHETDPLAASWVGVEAGFGSDRSFIDDIPAGLTYFAVGFHDLDPPFIRGDQIPGFQFQGGVSMGPIEPLFFDRIPPPFRS